PRRAGHRRAYARPAREWGGCSRRRERLRDHGHSRSVPETSEPAGCRDERILRPGVSDRGAAPLPRPRGRGLVLQVHVLVQHRERAPSVSHAAHRVRAVPVPAGVRPCPRVGLGAARACVHDDHQRQQAASPLDERALQRAHARSRVLRAVRRDRSVRDRLGRSAVPPRDHARACARPSGRVPRRTPLEDARSRPRPAAGRGAKGLAGRSGVEGGDARRVHVRHLLREHDPRRVDHREGLRLLLRRNRPDLPRRPRRRAMDSAGLLRRHARLRRLRRAAGIPPRAVSGCGRRIPRGRACVPRLGRVLPVLEGRVRSAVRGNRRRRRRRSRMTRSPRVLVVARSYPSEVLPTLGLWTERPTRALNERCDVRVVSPVPYCPPLPSVRPLLQYTRFRHIPSRDVVNGVQVIRPRYAAGPATTLYALEPAAWSRALAPAVDRLYREWPFDLVHAHLAYPEGVAAARIARRFRVPLVISEHAPWEPWLRRFGVARQVVPAARTAAALLPVSTSVRDTMLGYLGSDAPPLDVVPPGVDGAAFPLGEAPRPR